MIGITLYHPLSGVTGVVDAVQVHSDGSALCRIEDHWFFVAHCRAPNA